MRTSDDRAQGHGEGVGQEVVEWMAVEGHHTERSSPLMMLLVEGLVHRWMVKQSVNIQKEQWDESRWLDTNLLAMVLMPMAYLSKEG